MALAMGIVVDVARTLGADRLVISNRCTSTDASAFATNHLGPFVLTEAPIPHLSGEAIMVIVTSEVTCRDPPGSTSLVRKRVTCQVTFFRVPST